MSVVAYGAGRTIANGVIRNVAGRAARAAVNRFAPYAARQAASAVSYARNRAASSLQRIWRYYRTRGPMQRSRGRGTTSGGGLRYRRNATAKRRKLLKRTTYFKKPKRSFVKKVEMVLAKDTPCGLYTMKDQYIIAPTVVDGQLAWVAGNNTNALDMNNFSWAKVGDATAVMFAGKTYAVDGGNSAKANTGNFDVSVKIPVEYQNVKYVVKNAMFSSGTLTVYTCFPKTTYPQSAYATTPLTVWDQAISQYTCTAQGGPNVSIAADHTYPGDKPTLYHAFNIRYATNVKTYRLGPGQSCTFTRYGPAKTYDFTASLPSSSLYQTDQKGLNQWVMMVWQPDLLVADATGSGTYRRGLHTGTTTTGMGLLVESTYTVCVRAPEETATTARKQVIYRALSNTIAAAKDTVTDYFQPSITTGTNT